MTDTKKPASQTAEAKTLALVEGKIKEEAALFANNVVDHLRGPAKLRASEILAESAIVAARAISGENTTLAVSALNSSMLNVSREAQSIIIHEGRTLAFRVVFALLSSLVK